MEWIDAFKNPPPFGEYVLLFARSISARDQPDPSVFVGARLEKYNNVEYECAYGDGYVPPYLIVVSWAKLPAEPKGFIRSNCSS